MFAEYSSGMTRSDWENFQVAFPNVVSESFEDETVVVNLVSGTYFTLKDTAAFIWNGIESKVDFREIVSLLSGDVDDQEIGVFIQQLRDYGLINPLEGPTTAGDPSWRDSALRIEYSTPILSVYSDLQDILLLDPVHDVDSAGWPVSDTGH
jgi:hypothetical protein